MFYLLTSHVPYREVGMKYEVWSMKYAVSTIEKNAFQQKAVAMIRQIELATNRQSYTTYNLKKLNNQY